MKHLKTFSFILLAGIVAVLAGLWITSTNDKNIPADESLTDTTQLPSGSSFPRVRVETSHGNFIVELYNEQAPLTVKNFLRYVEEDAYASSIFHRVIKDFMIQGGGYSTNYFKKPVHEPIMNEANNGLKNVRGTIAMARTREPHSATRQFFINVVDNDFLDHKNKTMTGWGYAVFGRVVEGMDVIDRISTLPTGKGGPFAGDVPKEKITINRITLVADNQAATPPSPD